MVTYHFPPSGSIGYKRPLKFAKYLPSNGWLPFILTVKRKSDKITDISLLDSIPQGLCIYQTSSIEPFRYKSSLRKKIKPNSESESKFGIIRMFNAFLFYTFKLFRILLEKFILIPDVTLGWLPFALISGIKIIKSKKIDIVYATAPPCTCLLISYLLTKITRKPLVIDYRDPWTFNPFYHYPSKIRQRFEEWLEYLVIKSSDRCITISNTMTNVYKHKYPQMQRKISTITNGFDPDDFVGLKAKKFDKFTLIYSGTFYGARNPQYFLEALKELYKENDEVKQKTQFIVLGIIEQAIRKSLHNKNLLQLINVPIHYLPYKENLTYMKGADVLVLIMNARNKVTIPAKVFDYLATGRPVLALAPEGPVSKLIRKTKSGVVIAPGDIRSIKSQIHKFYTEYAVNKNTSLYNNIDSIQYSCILLTKKLVKLLDQIL